MRVGMGRTHALLLQLMIVSRPVGSAPAVTMGRAASAAAAFQPCGGGIGQKNGNKNGNKVGNQAARRTSPFVGGTPLDISEQKKMTEGWVGGVNSKKRGLRKMVTASSDQPGATRKDDDEGGGRVDVALRSGKQPGFYIVNHLTVPHPLPPSALQNEKEAREGGGVSLPMALLSCFPDSFPSMSFSRKHVRRGEVLSEGPNGGLVELNTTAVIMGGERLLLQQSLQPGPGPGLFPRGESPLEKLPVIHEDGHSALRRGTRPGLYIVNHLTVPHSLPPSALQNEKEAREGGGISLPMALLSCFPDSFPSMSFSRKHVRQGAVLSQGPNGGLVELNTTTVIMGGERLLLQQSLQPGPRPRGQAPFEFPVIYEDDHVAVVVKPPGVAAHKGEHAHDTVKAGLAYALKPSRAPEPLQRPMPCHRLDTPTGGLLIAAKSRLAIRKISRQFEEREISKTYRAIVCGRVDGEGTIDMPLSGKESLSLYKALRVCPSLKHGEVTLVELSPRTGRTHQLRRHMSQGLGKPLVGDRIYAGGDVPVDDVGLMLWATKIEFAHPVDGRRLMFESEVPVYFEEFLEGQGRSAQATRQASE